MSFKRVRKAVWFISIFEIFERIMSILFPKSCCHGFVLGGIYVGAPNAWALNAGALDTGLGNDATGWKATGATPDATEPLGCEHLGSHTGIYASDPDAYDVFSDVFYPVLLDYHKVKELKHPKPDFGNLNNLGFGDLDPSGTMINSTRIRVGRSHANYGFPPTSTKQDLLDMEEMTVDALKSLRGELRGKYYPLLGMTPAVQKQMIEDHFLFRDDDPVLRDAYGYDNWPTGRGIFFSHNKKFLVWVNEEDHLRIISMQQGGDLAEVWTRLVKGLKMLERKLTFAHHPKFGYLTFCPTNLGTTLRASVHIKIPNLSKHKNFKAICEGLNLQPRGIHGEHSESKGGVYDISNKRRMGLSEIEAVQEMRTGVEKIIELEKKLAAGQRI